jgi:glutamate formiminotransferase / formiminotetrahydrofolate cyclodeaminase
MQTIVECVPNFSDGRNPEVHAAIGRAIESVPGVRLLDVDPDASYNRVVVTFVGEKEAVVEAAFRATEVAVKMIDMREHHGEHPRFGAIDVCPFIPVRGVTMADCAELARQYGKRTAAAFDVPVYLYEQAAARPERKNLAKVREGEYEGLPEKLANPDWAPDFGPAEFVPTFGAVATGARFFLVAYNVNVDTPDVAATDHVALGLRQLGRPKTTPEGEFVLNATGKKVFTPGKLRMVKAMGVPIEDGRRTQISMNLNNYLVTPPHVAYEEAVAECAAHGLTVTGSEVVGLLPAAPLMMAAHWALRQEGRTARGLSDREMVQVAHDYLKLSDYKPFDAQKKVIEFAVED